MNRRKKIHHASMVIGGEVEILMKDGLTVEQMVAVLLGSASTVAKTHGLDCEDFIEMVENMVNHAVVVGFPEEEP